MSSYNCCFLTCIQISQEAGKVVWYSHLLKNFPQEVVIHIVRYFSIVSSRSSSRSRSRSFFLGLSCFFYASKDVGNLISGSSAFSKSSLNIWKFIIHVLLKPGLENFEHYLGSLISKLIKTESRKVVARSWGRTDGALLLNEF